MAPCLYGFTQEPISGVGITAIGQHEGDQPTVPVECAEQVFPLACYTDVGLVHSPEAGARSLVEQDPPFDFRRIALNQRKIVDGSTATPRSRIISARSLIADAVLAVPAHA